MLLTACYEPIRRLLRCHAYPASSHLTDVEDGEDDGGAGDRSEREVRVGQDHGGRRRAAAAVRARVSAQ